MASTLRPRRRLRRRNQRGAALLMAVVSVAMLTALAVDLTYETQVRLRIAANARDELRAQAMAQSAVTMSRLVLSMQQQVDRMAGAVCQAQGALAGGGAGAPACPRPQLWNMVPVSSAITQSMFTEGSGAKAAGGSSAKAADQAKPAAAAGEGPALQAAAVADFRGGYEARIEDEGQKINVQLDGTFSSGVLAAQVESILRAVCDSKWDPLFDRTDADGQRYSRSDLVVNLRDWVDDDANGSSLSASFPGGNCSFVVANNPFEKGFSDENVPYDRGTDRYRAKNARFDSLEELHMVAGITDPFMAAFGDQLTVYMPRDPQINVNTMDARGQLRIAWMMADDASKPKVLDPTFQALLQKAINAITMGGLLSMTPQQFAQTLDGLGVKVRSQFTSQSSTSAFTDKSPVYRIRAKGVAGDVTHEIDAVVTYNARDLPPDEQPPTMGAAPSNKPPLGALIHWRED
jgi:general secretion pathway protein K